MGTNNQQQHQVTPKDLAEVLTPLLSLPSPKRIVKMFTGRDLTRGLKLDDLVDGTLEKDQVTALYLDVVTGIVHTQRTPLGSPILRVPSWFYRNYPIPGLLTEEDGWSLNLDKHCWEILGVNRDVLQSIPVHADLWQECILYQTIHRILT